MSPGEAEGPFLWELVSAPWAPAPTLWFPPGNPVVLVRPDLVDHKDTSGALSPLCACMNLRVSTEPGAGVAVPLSDEVISEVGRNRAYLPCSPKTCFPGQGRHLAASKTHAGGDGQNSCGCRQTCTVERPVPWALSSDPPRTRSFKWGRRKGKPDFLEKEMKGGCPELSYGGRCLLQQEGWRIDNRENPPLPTLQRIKKGKDTKEPARGRRNEKNSLVWGQGLFLPSSLILSLPLACCSGSRAESPGGRGGWVGSVKAT